MEETVCENANGVTFYLGGVAYPFYLFISDDKPEFRLGTNSKMGATVIPLLLPNGLSSFLGSTSTFTQVAVSKVITDLEEEG